MHKCFSDPDEEIKKRCQKSLLWRPMFEQPIKPIIFHPDYDIRFFGIEKCHPFDAGKWGRVYRKLVERGCIAPKGYMKPVEATRADLLLVHTKGYLSKLNWSVVLMQILEVPFLCCFPAFVIHRKVMRRFRLHVGGTVLAARVALLLGAAVNIGGGFHHCSSRSGGGFCPYADITLALRFLFAAGLVSSVMIVDLDAHQGNGHERDFVNDQRVFILDVYNRFIYPFDSFAKRAIGRCVELDAYTESAQYLELLESALKDSLNEFKPDFVLYNAGTDCLDGDALGALSISAKGIIDRDELVFKTFRKLSEPAVPIVMLTSGGYQRNNAEVIADSLANLMQKGYLRCPE